MELSDDAPKKLSKATLVRRVLVVALVIACAGVWIYTRYLVKKGTLGEPCSYDMHCRVEAPRCLKSEVDQDGVCSRSCDTDADCAVGITCMKVELEDRDERGRPLEGGYCFPKSILDARRAKKRGDGGAAKASSDSWVDVPESSTQLEGEITVKRGSSEVTYELKGSILVAPTSNKHGRTVVDTTTLRAHSVDDDKKSFSAWQITSGPDARVTKTDRRDTVAGRGCEVWILEDEKSKANREACVVLGAAFVDPAARVTSSWEKELAVRQALALRVEEKGTPLFLVTRFDAHPIARDRVAVPKTYRNLAK